MRGVLKPREERRVNDSYFTPQPLADEICERLRHALPAQRAIWDPCCGDLAFVNAAIERWGSDIPIYGTDVAGPVPRDFLKEQPPNEPEGWSLLVSNPPYLLAEPFVHRALALVREGGHVAFLLRLSFLCGQRRFNTLWSKGWFRYLLPITPRPSFTLDGKTDASEYGVFVWQRGYTGNAEILPHLRWSNKQTRLLP